MTNKRKSASSGNYSCSSYFRWLLASASSCMTSGAEGLPIRTGNQWQCILTATSSFSWSWSLDSRSYYVRATRSWLILSTSITTSATKIIILRKGTDIRTPLDSMELKCKISIQLIQKRQLGRSDSAKRTKTGRIQDQRNGNTELFCTLF